MAQVITAHFPNIHEAERAQRELRQMGLAEADVAITDREDHAVRTLPDLARESWVREGVIGGAIAGLLLALGLTLWRMFLVRGEAPLWTPGQIILVITTALAGAGFLGLAGAVLGSNIRKHRDGTQEVNAPSAAIRAVVRDDGLADSVQDRLRYLGASTVDITDEADAVRDVESRLPDVSTPPSSRRTPPNPADSPRDLPPRPSTTKDRQRHPYQ